MILILTPYSFNPLHPRLEYIEKYLIKNNYEVRKYNLNCKNRIINKLNWISLTFFQIPSFFKAIWYLWKYRKKIKIVYIQDLQYLPIAIIIKFFKKKVIYETLDNNAELKFYHLTNRFKFFKKMVFIKKSVVFIEKKITKYFCDETIVNSDALVKYFQPFKVNLLYYTSPYEKKIKSSNDKEIIFLYLGGFLRMKGADFILDFVERYDKKLFIYGTLNKQEKDIVDKLKILEQKGLVNFTDRLPSYILEKKLFEVFNIYKPIGFSLTQEVNLSNATQEINKDIDYLAMGVPLIGNYRKPTREKIEAGCGVFFSDDSKINKLLGDNAFYREYSNNCINYYNEHYAQNIFENKLLEIIENV